MNRKEPKRFSASKNKEKVEEMFRQELEAKKNDSIAKLETLKGLFEMNYQKIQKNCEELKSNYDSILQILEKAAI